MNGTIVFRCVACLAFLVMMLLPGRLSAEAGDSGKIERVKKNPFGKLPDGTEIQQFTLHNSKGAVAKVITYGATLTELWMPDKSGKNADVVLGFANLAGYTLYSSTTARTPCTAAKLASIAKSGKRNPLAWLTARPSN